MEKKSVKKIAGKLIGVMALVLCLTFFYNSPMDYHTDEHKQSVDDLQSDVPFSYVLASNERVVKTYAELKDALSNDNGITTVYLGNNITMQSTGVRINPKKTNIIIDGFNPLDPNQALRYTLTDYASATFTDIIYVDASGPKTVLVRDLVIIGKNYYGPVGILDSSALASLAVTFERVDYNGPTAAFHRQGTVRFIDCKMRIHGGNGGSQNQEFSEVKHLIFQGINTIDTATANFSVFWIPYGGTFKIEDDSSLALTSANTSATLGVFYADAAAYKVDISIGAHAVFDVTISSIVAPALYVTLNSLTVQEGGSFYLKTTKAATAAVLSMGGNLIINKNANFKITGFGGAGYTLLDQLKGDLTVEKSANFQIIASGAYSTLINLNGHTLTINDPDSVILYNTNRVIQSSSAAGRVYINAEQINYWSTVSPGGLNSLPQYGWKKTDGTNLWVDATLATGSGGNFSGLTSNYAAGDLPGTAPSQATFNMVNARVLAFGRLALNVTAPTTKSASITGTTVPGAAVRGVFTQEGMDYTFPETMAGANGVFDIPVDTSLEVSTIITVKSSYQYLYATVQAVVEEGGKVSFSVPDALEFSDTEITLSAKMIERLKVDWSIIVSDTRGTGSEWSVLARLVQPLTPSNEALPILTDALVFVDNNSVVTPLSIKDRLLIYHHVTVSADDVTVMQWAPNQGILVRIPPGAAYAAHPYTGAIEWTLSDTP